MVSVPEMKSVLENDEYALIINSKGQLKGVFAPHELVDYDQLPATIITILIMLYGNNFEFTLPNERIIN